MARLVDESAISVGSRAVRPLENRPLHVADDTHRDEGDRHGDENGASRDLEIRAQPEQGERQNDGGEQNHERQGTHPGEAAGGAATPIAGERGVPRQIGVR